MPSERSGFVSETPDKEAETVALEGYDPTYVSLKGLRAAQRAWERGEFPVDDLARMAEWYTQHIRNRS